MRNDIVCYMDKSSEGTTVDCTDQNDVTSLALVCFFIFYQYSGIAT